MISDASELKNQNFNRYLYLCKVKDQRPAEF